LGAFLRSPAIDALLADEVLLLGDQFAFKKGSMATFSVHILLFENLRVCCTLVPC
jgi:hypothetical protein